MIRHEERNATVRNFVRKACAQIDIQKHNKAGRKESKMHRKQKHIDDDI